ncbi:hypothetical protein MWN52_11320 [Pseudoxanthomonas winnipegensis]|uniref:hypothetical protein n=1 Tax=Pseudoxanthomonas winnipegensis TaxID=2480810 RepID=UPI002577319B|nr:hypothetical protein [Pseudoxanthomonas winnipegensis]WJI14237.1 hypothetical protein MWN52_11320 [Pseudoxanthomonas winnipegensis]
MLAIAAAGSFIARADEKLPAFVMPKTSQLKVVGEIRPREPVNFSGQERIAGDLLAEWEPGESGEVEPSYLIVPDAPSAARLPHFKGYGISVIDVSNGEETLAMMLGDDQARQLLSDRHMKRVLVHGAFVITDYEMTIECDSPWARARVISAERPRGPPDAPGSQERC